MEMAGHKRARDTEVALPLPLPLPLPLCLRRALADAEAALTAGARETACARLARVASWAHISALVPDAGLDAMLAWHDALAREGDVRAGEAFICDASELAMLDVAPTPASAWHVWRSARFRPLVRPLGGLVKKPDAWGAAPAAVLALMRAHAQNMGVLTAVRAKFAVGTVRRGKPGKDKDKTRLCVVYVCYTQPVAGAVVHVTVHGMTSAAGVHVGTLEVLAETKAAAARWRETPALAADADVFAEARAIAQAEVLRMQLPCTCIAEKAVVMQWVERDMVRCACAGGLAAAATRHERTLRDAGVAVHCPLTGFEGGLDAAWWGWSAAASSSKASPRAGVHGDKTLPTLHALLLQLACRFWVSPHAHAVRWQPVHCPARGARGTPWTDAQLALARSVGSCVLPHVPARIPTARMDDRAAEWGWHYPACSGDDTDGGTTRPDHWLCVYCAERMPAAAHPLTPAELWDAFVAFAKKSVDA